MQPNPTVAKAIASRNAIYLVSLAKDSTATPIVVGKTVKNCYEFAKFVGQLSEPNLSYKAAVAMLKISGRVYLWNKAKYGTPDLESPFFPSNDHVVIQYVKQI